MSSSTTVVSYLVRITQIFYQFAAIGEVVDDTELVNVALSGLPGPWEPFVQGIYAREKLSDFDQCYQHHDVIVDITILSPNSRSTILSPEKFATFSSGDNIATFSKMSQYYRKSINVAHPTESGILKASFGFFSLILLTNFGVWRAKEQEPKF
jgi:hypothetical protein